VVAILTTTSVAAALAVATPAAADHEGFPARLLERAVTVDEILRHQLRFQAIALANGGNRAAGTRGYDQSAQYVFGQLRRAGYDVSYQPFEFPFFDELSDAELEQISPDPTTYTLDEDFATMTFSGSGEVTAEVQGVDLQLPPSAEPNGSTSGCEDGDFVNFVPGNIALIQRGTCTFADKAVNADEAGASAVIIFNEGQEGRTETLQGTLGGPVVDIPVVGTSFEVGVDLADPGTVARVKTDTESEIRTTSNVIAETPGGRADNVVMIGAHLDSVISGPGIQDNGSGSAAILEVALQLADRPTVNKVRFAWWSAEELGLIGSTFYVDSLIETGELDDVALYLNFDMISSPNFMRGVYDGDGSSFGLVGPEGSAQIEAEFEAHFTNKGLPFQGTEFSGRSDYQAFINNGIPSGGLFTGAEGLKTEEEAAIYGGVAGEQYDPCYHEACDSFTPIRDGADAELYAALNADYPLVGNVNLEALNTNADAIAHLTAKYAVSTASVTQSAPAATTAASNAGRPAPGMNGDVAA